MMLFSGKGASIICGSIASLTYLYFCSSCCSCDFMCIDYCFWRIKCEYL